MNIFRLSDSDQVEHHLVVPKKRYTSTTHDTLFEQYGVTRHATQNVARSMAFKKEFEVLIRQHGPFDIVHGHNDYVGGPVVRLAQKLGVNVRVTHAHNDTRYGYRRASILKKRYIDRSHKWVDQYATHGFAASDAAGLALYRGGWGKDSRFRPLYYGIDLDRFEVGSDGSVMRRKLKIPEDAFVIGNVGRFHPQKNHDLILEVARQVLPDNPNVYFVLLSDGPTRHEYELQAQQIQGGERVLFLGIRDDVPDVMCNVMDVFFFPSRWEGLGIVLLEAQAAGLPYVASDVIPHEADVLEGFGLRRKLTDPASVWAQDLLAWRDKPRPMAQVDGLALLRGGDFDSDNSAARLVACYQAFVGRSVEPK